MKNTKKILLAIIIIAILIRIFGIGNILTNDESAYSFSIRDREFFSTSNANQPPLFHWTGAVIYTIFPFDTVGIRLQPFIFSILNILMVYLICKRFFSKKIGLIAAGIMTFSYWHLFGSLMIETNGSSLMFFSLLSIYFYFRFDDEKNYKFLVLSGLFFGLALLTRITAILLIGIIGLYHLWQTKKVWKTAKDISLFVMIGGIIYSIFPILSFLIDPFFFYQATIGHNLSYVQGGGLFSMTILIQFLQALIISSPLFTGLLLVYLVNFKKESYNKKELMFLIQMIVVFLFYTLIVKDPFRPVERYFMILIPGLSILGAIGISKLRFYKRELMFSTISLLLLFLLLFIPNLMESRFLPFYPKTGFINEAISLNWNFLVPFTGGSGPAGFYLTFTTIALGFILAFGFLMIGIYFTLMRKNKVARIFILLFLSASLAYNFVLIEEYLFSSANPDIDLINVQIRDYAIENDLNEPVYIFRNFALRYYIDDKYDDIRFLDFHNDTAEKAAVLGQELGEERASVLFIDFPSIDKEGNLFKTLNECKKRKTFSDKGTIIGYVFEC
ncbi:MAG: glycosyltransferase family 39 protein [Candidatus Woesearchaeota archaeon]